MTTKEIYSYIENMIEANKTLTVCIGRDSFGIKSGQSSSYGMLRDAAISAKI